MLLMRMNQWRQQPEPPDELLCRQGVCVFIWRLINVLGLTFWQHSANCSRWLMCQLAPFSVLTFSDMGWLQPKDSPFISTLITQQSGSRPWQSQGNSHCYAIPDVVESIDAVFIFCCAAWEIMDDLWAYIYKSLVKDGGSVGGQSLYIPVYLVAKKAVLCRWWRRTCVFGTVGQAGGLFAQWWRIEGGSDSGPLLASVLNKYHLQHQHFH